MGGSLGGSLGGRLGGSLGGGLGGGLLMWMFVFVFLFALNGLGGGDQVDCGGYGGGGKWTMEEVPCQWIGNHSHFVCDAKPWPDEVRPSITFTRKLSPADTQVIDNLQEQLNMAADDLTEERVSASDQS